MAVERPHVPLRQVIGPALCLFLFDICQIPQEELLGHQDAAEDLARDRTGWQIERREQAPVVGGEQRLMAFGGDQSVPKVGCYDATNRILAEPPHPFVSRA